LISRNVERVSVDRTLRAMLAPSSPWSESQARRATSLRSALNPVLALRDDPAVVEVMLKADGAVWIDRIGSGMSRTDVRVQPAEAERMLRLVASEMLVELDPTTPSLYAKLPAPCGARLQASIPTIVEAPTFALRKPARIVFSHSDYVAKRNLTPAHHNVLEAAIARHDNILIGGGTGWGKTTFANLADRLGRNELRQERHPLGHARRLAGHARDRAQSPKDRERDGQKPCGPLHRRISLGQGARTITLQFRQRPGPLVFLLAALASTACIARTPPASAFYVRAQAVADPAPVRPGIVEVPQSPAFNGQLKPMPSPPASNRQPHTLAPEQVLAQANRKASQSPQASDYFNAIVEYPFEPGTLYQVFAAPMRVTDIALEPGEKILGQPASGDVVRWVLAVGRSMDHGQDEQHVYIKPTRPELETNVAINTDRRTYFLELHSYPDAYMAAVTWHYPQDDLAHLQAEADAAWLQGKSAAPVVSLDALNFNYTIRVVRGAPVWTPVQAFDDGRRTFIRLPRAMLVREAPVLFVLRDSETQLVNYRVKGDTYVVDRLIDSAELRVGQQDQEVVRVERAPSK
jgi:type IV secretion system protein VirB9